MFILTILLFIPQHKSYKVISIKTPCEIELDNEKFILNGFTCFDPNFTSKNKELANVFNISEEEAFILGNLSKYWVENLIKGRKVKIKNDDITFNNFSYSKKFEHSGFAIQNNKLVIIDFDRHDYGDPYQEFNRIVWCAQAAPTFAKGIVDGYFDNLIPLDFWKLLALYICVNNVSSIPWAIPYGEKEVNVMIEQTKDILLWYNNY